MGIKRQEKALREFKHILEDIVYLLRQATGVETVCLHWVNRSRKQFVLETHSTSLPNVMFPDRVAFDSHYLDPFKDIEGIVQFPVGDKVKAEDLRHYYDFVPVRHITLIPFINNGETVAITTVESEKPVKLADYEQAMQAYKNALLNVLNTYLEVTDLYEKQQEWVDYQESIDKISPRHHRAEIIEIMLNEMQHIVPNGGAAFLARGMDVWTTVLTSVNAKKAPEIGLQLEEKSLAYEALQKGRPEFAIHFNQNPKQITSSEKHTDGASIAIPMMIDDRRHGVIVVWDDNPLIFKESIKHQLINLARVASLAIQVNMGRLTSDQDMLTSSYSSFIPDLWEKTVNHQITRLRRNESVTWFGLITLDDLQSLRSRLRLEELQRLQRTLVKALNPSRFGINGFIGFNSDYVFTYVLQGNESTLHDSWLEHVTKLFDKPVILHNGEELDIRIKLGFTKVDQDDKEVHDVISKAKLALAHVVKDSSRVSYGA